MLESLEIKNFRSLKDFHVARLGRVNLIVGKNNSGKSSVLEALRIYAGNAQRGLLEQIAIERDEKYTIGKNEPIESDMHYPFEDFFIGRHFSQNEELAISIGEMAPSDNVLQIKHGFLIEEEYSVKDELGNIIERRNRLTQIAEPSHEELSSEAISQALFVTKGKHSLHSIQLDKRRNSFFRNSPMKIFGTIPCSVIPTPFIPVDVLAKEWEKVHLTDHEEIIRQALQIIEPKFENLKFVSKDDFPPKNRHRFAEVKISDSPHLVPLNSLGDGMLRVLQIILKVNPAKGGFLLIDEFENGLHFSVQEKVWAMLFELAEKLDIQIFATTHSWDCIESFTNAARNNKSVEGMLFRVGRSAKKSNRGQVIATVFDEDALYNITQADVEVR